MASLLSEPLFEISGQAPPPNKDFYHFSISKAEVIWRWWKISLRTVYRYSRPGEQRTSHQDFLNDALLQSEVRMVFGRNIFWYAKALCQGRYDYLERLSDSVLLQIIRHLELEDVGQLGRTSRRFKKLCGSEEFWEQAVLQRCTTVPAEVASLAQELGWRSVFFSNKLHLQKLLNRRRLKVSDPHREAEDNSEKPASLSAMLCHLCTDAGSCSCCDPDPDHDHDHDHDPDPDPDHDPDPDLEAEPGCDSIKLVAEQLQTGLKVCELEASGEGDCSAEPAKELR